MTETEKQNSTCTYKKQIVANKTYLTTWFTCTICFPTQCHKKIFFKKSVANVQIMEYNTLSYALRLTYCNT